ncbi:UNVERIFIED_CONTAM: Retrovirus-related Pol polyprotein from transposon [Sesamum indicum]
MIQMTREELQHMIDEASRKAIVEYERRTVTPAREGVKRQLFQELETEQRRETLRAPERGPERTLSNEIEQLGKQIEELKKRGELVSQNRSSPFTNRILLEVVDNNFRFPDLPKYDGSKDPREHVAAFDLVMNLYGQTDPIKAKLFVTTLKGKAQEWFTSLGSGTIDSYEQLIHKFSFHFASKRKAKRSATHLFTIRQREDETLKTFMGRFNNEVLEVQDLRIDMMVSILIHGLQKGPFASALARDPPTGTEQLMEMAQKYIDEEEMNAMKDNYWSRDPTRTKGERSREGKQRAEGDRERKGPYVPRYHRYTPLMTTREKVMMMVENEGLLQQPEKMRDTRTKRNSNKYCRFHKDRGHNTEDCYQLKDEIERLIRQGYFKHLIDRRAEQRDRSRSRSRERLQRDEAGASGARDNAPNKGVIHTISGGPTSGDSSRARKRYARESRWKHDGLMMHVEKQESIIFGDEDLGADMAEQNDPMVIKMDIANYQVHKVLIDNGSSVDIIFSDVLRKMDLRDVKLKAVRTPLVGFGGNEVIPEGVIELPVSLGEEPKRKTCMISFLVVDSPFAYNVVLGRPGLNKFRAVVSTFHLKMKFPTPQGIGEVKCDQRTARQCYNLAVKQGESKREKRKEETSREAAKRGKMERIEPSGEYKEVELISGNFQTTTRIGSQMTTEMETMMIDFLRSNHDLFAWSPSDFQVKQKKRVFGVERNKIIEEEVAKLLRAGFVREVQYTTWLSNVVVVPKAAGKWRMCTDYTDLNKACPKDPYPLPRIDLLVDSTAGCALFSMMDAYQGYHQIFMAKEDAEKTAFVTEKGVYCYDVMPFGLKNAGATYQRLVNRMFKDHIGNTMEVYVDDMLVKSKKEDDHLTNLRTAFDIMRSYGMKLNPSKCTFGVRGRLHGQRTRH